MDEPVNIKFSAVNFLSFNPKFNIVNEIVTWNSVLFVTQFSLQFFPWGLIYFYVMSFSLCRSFKNISILHNVVILLPTSCGIPSGALPIHISSFVQG